MLAKEFYHLIKKSFKIQGPHLELYEVDHNLAVVKASDRWYDKI